MRRTRLHFGQNMLCDKQAQRKAGSGHTWTISENTMLYDLLKMLYIHSSKKKHDNLICRSLLHLRFFFGTVYHTYDTVKPQQTKAPFGGNILLANQSEKILNRIQICLCCNMDKPKCVWWKASNASWDLRNKHSLLFMWPYFEWTSRWHYQSCAGYVENCNKGLQESLVPAQAAIKGPSRSSNHTRWGSISGPTNARKGNAAISLLPHVFSFGFLHSWNSKVYLAYI